jgi:hypothetical protein
MSTPETKLVTPKSLAVDAVLVLAFFVYMFGVVKGHVPSKDPMMLVVWGGACSFCLTLVFWLTLQMFRVVVKAQRAGRSEPK